MARTINSAVINLAARVLINRPRLPIQIIESVSIWNITNTISAGIQTQTRPNNIDPMETHVICSLQCRIDKRAPTNIFNNIKTKARP